VKTNFFPIHNSRPTICILYFLRHLYFNITLRILKCFIPQGTNIEVTTLYILLVECCEMVTDFARNVKIYNIFFKIYKFVEKTQMKLLNNTHHHVLCAGICFITWVITDNNLLCFGIYSHSFMVKQEKKNLFRQDGLNVSH
jgi:hypothetical protein